MAFGGWVMWLRAEAYLASVCHIARLAIWGGWAGWPMAIGWPQLTDPSASPTDREHRDSIPFFFLRIKYLARHPFPQVTWTEIYNFKIRFFHLSSFENINNWIYIYYFLGDHLFFCHMFYNIWINFRQKQINVPKIIVSHFLFKQWDFAIN